MHLRRRNTGKKERTKTACMDEARVFRFILEKVKNEKERSRIFRHTRSTELVTLVGGSE